jgi:hypothetical protein
MPISRPLASCLVIAVSALSALATTACQRQQSVPPAAGTTVGAARNAELPPMPASGADTSVPDAGRVLAQGAAAASAPGSGEPTVNQKADMTREQEYKSMPLPGQANDHSNTVGEKKPAASAPAR